MSAVTGLRRVAADPSAGALDARLSCAFVAPGDIRRRLHHAWHGLSAEALEMLTPDQVADVAAQLGTPRAGQLVTVPELEWPVVLDTAIHFHRLPHTGMDPWRGIVRDAMVRAEVRLLDITEVEPGLRLAGIDAFEGTEIEVADTMASRLLRAGDRAVMRLLQCGELVMATTAWLQVSDETLFEMSGAIESFGVDPREPTSRAWSIVAFREALKGARLRR